MSDPNLADPALAQPKPPATPDAKVTAAEQKVIDVQKAADDAKKSPEQLAVEKAKADADDVRTKALEDGAAARQTPDDMTVGEAGVHLPAGGSDLSVGDHMAQVFRNMPENPPPATGDHSDPEKQTVKMVIDAHDHPAGVNTTMVHPELVGDYQRAGWNRA